MPGRPKKKRQRHPTKEPNRVSRVGREMTCKNCCQKGHNKKTCKNEPKEPPARKKAKTGSTSAANQGTQPMEHDGEHVPADEPSVRNVDEPMDEHLERNVDEPMDEPLERNVEEPMDEPLERNVEEPATQECHNVSTRSRAPSYRILRQRLARTVVAKDGSGTSSKPIVME